MKAFNYVSMRLLVFDNVEYSYNDSCSGQKKLKLSFKIRKEYLILAMGTKLHVCKIVQIWHFNNVFYFFYFFRHFIVINNSLINTLICIALFLQIIASLRIASFPSKNF